MRSGLSSNAYEMNSSDQQSVPRISRGMLLMLITIIYSGAFQFLVLFSSNLLYGFYLTLIACILLCLFAERQVNHNLRSMAPYFVWIIFYCLWGTIVAPYKNLILPDVIRVVVRNALLLGAVAIALVDMRNVNKLALLIQAGAILNCIIAIWEVFEPDIILSIAYTLNSEATAFNERRPAGLWSNPDEAAFAFLFALLLSRWTRGPLAWMGRIASIVGIYLSASRAGAYLLLLYGLLYLFFKLKSVNLSLGRITILVNGIALIICLSWAILYQFVPSNIDLSDNWNIHRILDFQENDSSRITRVQVTSLAAQRALDGPWYGNGIFSFQLDGTTSYSVLPVGAHNIYLVTLGETGVFGMAGYLIVLGVGLYNMLKARMVADERFTMTLIWGTYLLIGLVWHNQFTSVASMIYVGLLYHLPRVIEAKAVSYKAIPHFALQGR
jgi:O-Antigen ligase